MRLQHAEEIVHRIEAEMALAEGAAPDDLSREIVRILAGLSAKVNPLANSQFSPGMHQRLPFHRLGRELLGEQHLDAPAKEIGARPDSGPRRAAPASRCGVRRAGQAGLSCC